MLQRTVRVVVLMKIQRRHFFSAYIVYVSCWMEMKSEFETQFFFVFNCRRNSQFTATTTEIEDM